MKYIEKFTDQALEDYQYWEKNDKKKVKKIDQLIDSCLKTPYSGLGKPEPLKHEYSGSWSRRIDQKNRLVYTVKDNIIIIEQCRFHY